ncbi:hypothetical protein PILCRDRAFT_824893 [Piloderma croceum F 1598]|uniref:Uncharacterized protein n=1 Tax=Piloderma croceum (strain F 1598) TaxID=765440 RepID=A0A0C3EZD0_PILCF|nr:hypothetical protein PILCRDRAFT_824893 [Piloderma croceum F 1598]
MAKPLQPCLVNPIPTSSSQTVIIYKHTYFNENANDLKDYPYFTGRSIRSQGNACTIHYVEFRCASTPPSDIGHPGDVWIDLTPDKFGLYAKVGADWKKWPGLLAHDDSLIVHPHVPIRVLWCTKRCVTWLNRKSILSDWATHRAEFSNDEAAQDGLNPENIIGRMLAHEESTSRKPDSAVVGHNAHKLPNVSETDLSSSFVSSSPTSTRSPGRPANLPNLRTSNQRTSLDSSHKIRSVAEMQSEQQLLDKISDLSDENRRLSEEVVRLREETAHRKSLGPFRDVVLAAVGEAAFSEELLDIAKDAAISQLMKMVTRLSEELHTSRTSYLDEVTNVSKKLNEAEISRSELMRCLTGFHSTVDLHMHKKTPEDDLLANNSGSDNNASDYTPIERTREIFINSDTQISQSQLETVSPSTTIIPEPFSSLMTYPGSSTVADDSAVVNLSIDLASSPSFQRPHSVGIENNVNLPGAESSLRDRNGSATRSASPTHASSSPFTNHPINDAGPIFDQAIQASRKRRLSQVVSAETQRSTVVHRAANGEFRQRSSESVPSTTDVEVANLSESSTSAGDDLGVGMTVKEEPSQLCLMKRSQSSECPSHRDKDERRLKQDHLDKLYTLDADRYFCHACFIRSEKVTVHSHKLPSASFPKTVSTQVLIGHYEKKHPETCKKFIDLWSRLEA